MTKIISGTLTISRDLRKSDQILKRYLKSLTESGYCVTSEELKIIDSQEDLPDQFKSIQCYGSKTPKTPRTFTEIKYEKEVRV